MIQKIILNCIMDDFVSFDHRFMFVSNSRKPSSVFLYKKLNILLVESNFNLRLNQIRVQMKIKENSRLKSPKFWEKNIYSKLSGFVFNWKRIDLQNIWALFKLRTAETIFWNSKNSFNKSKCSLLLLFKFWFSMSLLWVIFF